MNYLLVDYPEGTCTDRYNAAIDHDRGNVLIDLGDAAGLGTWVRLVTVKNDADTVGWEAVHCIT